MAHREVVLRSAATVLPTELSRARKEAVAESIGCTADGLEAFLIESYIEPLLQPFGDAMPKLTDASSEQDASMLSDLYWRCAVAVTMMPLGALKGLARHHEDLTPFLAAADAPEPEQRLALVRAILPRFSMVCTTRAEAEAAERRKLEIQERRRELNPSGRGWLSVREA